MKLLLPEKSVILGWKTDVMMVGARDWSRLRTAHLSKLRANATKKHDNWRATVTIPVIPKL